MTKNRDTKRIEQKNKKPRRFRGPCFYKHLLIFTGRKMVGVKGFEPSASASRTQRSTKLSHTPTEIKP